MAEIVSFNPSLGIITIAAAPDEDLTGFTIETYARSGASASFQNSVPVDLSDPQVSESDPTFVFYTFTLVLPTGNSRNAIALVDTGNTAVDVVGWGNDNDFPLVGGSAGGTVIVAGNENFGGDNDNNWYAKPPGGTWDGDNGSPDDGLPEDLVPFVPPCFTPGTRIATPDGPRTVESLRVGDVVLTHDGAVRTIRWIGRRRVSFHTGASARRLRPILIRKDAFGPGRPNRDMRVSPRHRVLVESAMAELHFGFSSALVAACHLVNARTIMRDDDCGSVEYIHLLFDRHEVLVSDGLPTESFHPGRVTLCGLDPAQRAELFELFPELEADPDAFGSLSLPALKRWEARVL